MNTRGILLFADGGSGVGAGHVFRLYPVFRSLLDLGVSAQMWSPLNSVELARFGLYDVHAAPTDINALILVLRHTAPAVAVLDTYQHLPELCAVFEKIGSRIAIFDDHFRVTRNVSVIINSSLTVRDDNYASGLADQFLLGSTYASIARNFAELRDRYTVSLNISHILIALGGEDVQGNLPYLLATLLPLLRRPVDISVLCACPVVFDVPTHVTLHWEWLQQGSLSQRMAASDLAILAGGTMLWQTACVGVPTISWPQTPRQERHAADWEQKGAVIVINQLDALPTALRQLASIRRRKQLSRAGREQVDGLGADRISCHLQSLLENRSCG